MTALATINVCDVLNQGLPTGTNPPIADDDIIVVCQGCRKTVSLSFCSIEQGSADIIYKCDCGDTLVIIATPNPCDKPWPGRGYRLKNFVLRNAVDLRWRSVTLPRSPNALARERRTE